MVFHLHVLIKWDYAEFSVDTKAFLPLSINRSSRNSLNSFSLQNQTLYFAHIPRTTSFRFKLLHCSVQACWEAIECRKFSWMIHNFSCKWIGRRQVEIQWSFSIKQWTEAIKPRLDDRQSFFCKTTHGALRNWQQVDMGLRKVVDNW